MASIRTVLGDISPQDLGVTLSHEHLLWAVPEPYRAEDPDLGFDDPQAAIHELQSFKLAGGSALVEMTTAEIGRRPVELAHLSRASGVHVIAASGRHKDKFSGPVVASLAVEAIAEQIVWEVTQGMDGTSIKAGVIKAGTSRDQATPNERKVIQAVGLAFQQTEAPVSTHTEAGTFALGQIELLEKAGVPAGRLLIGHLDRGLSWQTYLDIAQKGVYLGFDQVSKEKYWPDAERASLIKSLVERGHEERLLLSGDMARKSNWPSYGPGYGPGLAYIPAQFKNRLAAEGLGEAIIYKILVENPARFFSF